MSTKTCYCPKCNFDEPFNPNECMFCSEKLNPEGGTLRSSNNARMCTNCLSQAYKLLVEADKEEINQ